MLHTAEAQFGDISGQSVIDLGCGCGILTIGAALLGSALCFGIDIDQGKPMQKQLCHDLIFRQSFYFTIIKLLDALFCCVLCMLTWHF